MHSLMGALTKIETGQKRRMMTKREGQEEQVEGSNKTKSSPSSSGPASAKMYSNVISHYITESWHAAAPLHVVTWTHTHTHQRDSDDGTLKTVALYLLVLGQTELTRRLLTLTLHVSNFNFHFSRGDN